MEEEGKNWAGKGARVVVTAGHFQILATNVDALALWVLLRMNHGARAAPFAVSPKAMAEANLIHGWGPKRYSAARTWLVNQGFLAVVHEGGAGPGDAWLYRFPNAWNKGSRTEPYITKPLPP